MNKADTKKAAAIEFEPWEADVIRKLSAEFSADGWSLKPDSGIAVDLRIATVIMSKTKPKLVEVARELGADVIELLDRLKDTAERLQALADLVQTAHARQIGCVFASEIDAGLA